MPKVNATVYEFHPTMQATMSTYNVRLQTLAKVTFVDCKKKPAFIN